MNILAQSVTGRLEIATTLVKQGRADEALALVQALLSGQDALSDAQHGQALLCQSVGELRALGRYAKALEHAQQSAFCFQSAGDLSGECRALAIKAIAATRLGHFETAVESALLGIKLSESLPMSEVQVLAYHALGIAAFSGKSFDMSRNAFLQAIQAANECDPPLNPFELHCDLASTVASRYFHERSTGGTRLSLDGLGRHISECDQLLEAAGGPRVDISLSPGSHDNNLLVLSLARVHMLTWQGKLLEAEQALADYRNALQRVRRPWYAAAVEWAEVELAMAHGRWGEAESRARIIVRIAEQHKHETLLSTGYQLLAYVCEQVGRLSEALELSRLLALREQKARSDALRNRVDVIEWQLELRDKQQHVHRLESDSRLFQRLALEDSLTGLANRRQFESQMSEWLKWDEALAVPIYLGMIDVDRFKQVNDSFSHHVGDEVLRAIAQILRVHVREQDLAARLAGDEFVIVLRDVDLAAAEAICERVRQAVQAHTWQDLAPGLNVSLSIGLSQVMPGDSLHCALQRSDAQMYAAKRAA